MRPHPQVYVLLGVRRLHRAFSAPQVHVQRKAPAVTAVKDFAPSAPPFFIP